MCHEYESLTRSVGYVELPQRSVIELRGDDRVTLLNNLCTADVKRLDPGQGCEAFLTNVKGKVIGHVFTLCHEDAIELSTAGGQAAAIMSHLDRYIIREDVQLIDRSDDYAHLLVSGPRSADCLAELFGDVPAKNLDHVGTESLVIRTPLIEPVNFLLRIFTDDQHATARRLADVGADRCDLAVFERLRIEACFPLYEADIDENNLPQEIGRDEQAISFTKGCYLGQETVARLDALGHVNWMLATLRFDGNQPIKPGSAIEVDGDVVAKVRSVAIGSPPQTTVMLAYVRSSLAKAGGTLTTSCGRFVVQAVAGQGG